MGTSPEDAGAPWTVPEFTKRCANTCRYVLDDCCGWNSSNRRIAAEAPAEGVHLVDQREGFEDFDQLLFGIRVSHPATALNGTAFEQRNISREHHASLAGRRVRDVPVLLKHERIETAQSQERREFAQMHINDEPDRIAHIGRDRTDSADIDGLERRIQRRVVTMLQPVRELFGDSVDEDQVDLWMRDAEPFERVFHRRTRGDGVSEPSSAVRDWQKIIQLCVEPKRHLDRVQRHATLEPCLTA